MGVLMVGIDVANSRTYTRCYEAETTRAAFDVCGRWAKRHGRPRCVYVDRHGIYRHEDHPQKPTQFGRAMKLVGGELICAHSPQAKGRVESRNAVWQDRRGKELRLRGISDMHGANVLREGKLLDELNRRYAGSAAKSGDLHRPVQAEMVLEEILCVQDPRVGGQDWCVRWQNRWLQIGREHEALALAGRRGLVKQLGCGELIVDNRRWKPAGDHPCNRGPASRADPRVSLAPAAPTGCVTVYAATGVGGHPNQ